MSVKALEEALKDTLQINGAEQEEKEDLENDLVTIKFEDGEADDVTSEDGVGQCLQYRREILARNSGFFRAAFNFEPNLHEVSFRREEISSGTCHKILVTLGHEEELDIGQEDAEDLLLGSVYLHCSRTEAVCTRFIVSRIDISSAFRIWGLAKNFALKQLEEAAESVIRCRVQSLAVPDMGPDQILDLSTNALKTFLCNIPNFSTWIWTLMGWIDSDKLGRVERSQSLVSGFPLELIHDQKAIEALSEYFPQVSNRIQGYSQLSLKGKLKFWSSEFELADSRLWPQMVAVSSTGNMLPKISFSPCWVNTTGSAPPVWHTLTLKPPGLKFASAGGKMCVVGGIWLYFIGGEGNRKLWRFDSRNNSWKVIFDKDEERVRPQVAVSGSKIYVFGGYTTSPTKREQEETESTAFVLDTSDHARTPLCPMSHTRSGGEAVYYRGKIFLFGGLSKTRQWVRECEMYDFVEDDYENLGDLPILARNFAAVLVRNTVYFLGGLDPFTMETKATVFTFNLDSREWSTDFPSLRVARHGCAGIFDGTHLRAIGGGVSGSLEQLNSCEKYCFEKRQWVLEQGSQLPGGLKSTMNAVVAELPVRLMENYGDLGQASFS